MRIEDLVPGIALTGLEPSTVATLVAVVPIAEGAVQVIYKTTEGELKDRLLGRADEAGIALATQERPWAFDGNGEDFKLVVEVKRIDLAFLFDPMMAVHTFEPGWGVSSVHYNLNDLLARAQRNR